MSPHVRKVRTASGATAVQVVTKRGGRRVKIVHVGSAHSDEELAVLEARARAMLPRQGELNLGLDSTDQPDTGQAEAVVTGQSSALLWQVLQHAWRTLGLDEATGGDRGFEQMCLARLVEPTSKARFPALIADLGIAPTTGPVSSGPCTPTPRPPVTCPWSFMTSPRCTSRSSLRTRRLAPTRA